MISQDLVNHIYGDRFSAAAKALQILIWVIPLVGCRVLFRNTLLSHGCQKQLLWSTSFAAAINAALNLMWIRTYSYLGSAAAMVIAEGILLFLVSRQVARKVTPLPLLAHFWRPALGCLVMVLLLKWCNAWALNARVVAGSLVYVAAVWLTGAFTFGEIRAALASSAPDADNQT